jgi:hypothetical protein
LLRFLDEGHSGVIIVDTLDQYDVKNSAMDAALGSLFHAVGSFSRGGAHANIQVKCFLPQEILPYILYSTMPNVGKVLSNPVYLESLLSKTAFRSFE